MRRLPLWSAIRGFAAWWATLHVNPYFGEVPCHRVVNAKGELAGKFVFGGADIQANMLRAEGVEVVGDRVDLTKYRM